MSFPSVNVRPESCSKVNLSGVNRKVIMSGCGDDNPDDGWRKEFASTHAGLKTGDQPAKAGIYVKDKDGSKIVLGFRSAIGCRSALRFHQKACCPPFWETHSWQFPFLTHEWLCVIDKDFPLLRYD